MPLPRKIWKTSRFHKGVGNIAGEGNFWWSKDIDLEASPPFVRVSPVLVKETDSTALANLADVQSSTIMANLNYVLNKSNGRMFNNFGGTWAEIHQITGGGLGLFGDSQPDDTGEKGRLYYASGSNAGYLDFTTTAWNDSWQNFAVSNGTDLCPIAKFLKFICFGNQRYLAVWDTGATSWNATRLTLPIGYKIKWLAAQSDYLVICAVHPTSGTTLFFWDGSSATYNRAIQLPGVVTAAGVIDKNTLYVITNDGWISVFDGTGLRKLNRFPDMEPGDTISLNPDAVKVFQGVILIGLKAHGQDMAKRYYAGGIWCFNPATNALYFKHTLSFAGTNNNSVTGIGSIVLKPDGSGFRAAWQSGAGYGIDALGTAPCKWGAFLVTSMLDDEPYRRKRFIQEVLNFWKPIPNSVNARYVLKYNITEKYQKFAGSASGGAANYFTLAAGISNFEIGDEVTVISGTGVGQIRHVLSVDTVANRVYVDEDLSDGAVYSNTSYLLLTPFKKIGVIKGSEVPGAVNKLCRFNARGKKLQIKVEIWSPAGFTGQYDMGLADLSTVYIPDRIIK